MGLEGANEYEMRWGRVGIEERGWDRKGLGTCCQEGMDRWGGHVRFTPRVTPLQHCLPRASSLQTDLRCLESELFCEVLPERSEWGDESAGVVWVWGLVGKLGGGG